MLSKYLVCGPLNVQHWISKLKLLIALNYNLQLFSRKNSFILKGLTGNFIRRSELLA